MTWFIDVIQVAPLALITAPEKQCGKTQLLILMERLSRRPLIASGISQAALFRSLEKWTPTFFLDEADIQLKDNEDLRLILNAGHSRDAAFIICTVGDNHEPTPFNVFGAKVICGIKADKIADTLTDRSIILELRRKLDHENVDRLRYAAPDLFTTLSAKLAKFADDNCQAVRLARPTLPPKLADRQQDNWEPLLAIAQVAGGDWLERATKTALALSGTESVTMSISVELLHDIRDVFANIYRDRISTADLITALCEDHEARWRTYNKGLPITPRQVSARLKEYGIVSNQTIRVGTVTAKGYSESQFRDAFLRYLPTPVKITVTQSQGTIDAALQVNSISNTDNIVTDDKTG